MTQNEQKYDFFDQKRGVYVKIFASQSLRRALRMPKSYLESSAEFKTGLKVEIGPEIRILAGREMDPVRSQAISPSQACRNFQLYARPGLSI